MITLDDVENIIVEANLDRALHFGRDTIDIDLFELDELPLFEERFHENEFSYKIIAMLILADREMRNPK